MLRRRQRLPWASHPIAGASQGCAQERPCRCLRRARRHPEGAPRRRQRRADTRKPAADEEALPRRVAEEIGRDPRCRYGVNTAVVHWWVDVHWTTIRLLSM